MTDIIRKFRKYNIDELLVVIITQFIVVLTSFINVKLMTNVLTVGDYGLYNIVLSFSFLFSLIPFSSFDQAVARYWYEYHDKKIYFTNIIIIYLFFIIVCCIFSFFLVYIIRIDFLNDIKMLFVWVLFFSILNVMRNFLLNIENNKRNRKSVLLSRLLEGVLKILFLYLLFVYGKNCVSVRNILVLVCIIYVIDITRLLIINSSNFDFKYFNYVVLREIYDKLNHFSMPLLKWAFFGWFTLNAPLWIVKNFFPKDILGYYSFYNNLAILIPSQVVSIFGSFLLPVYYEKFNDNKKNISQIQKMIFMFLLPFFIITFFIIKQFGFKLTTILSNINYVTEVWMLEILYICYVVFYCGQFFTIEIFVYKRTDTLLLANIIPSLIIGVSIFFVNNKVYCLFVFIFISYLSYFLLVLNEVIKYRKTLT